MLFFEVIVRYVLTDGRYAQVIRKKQVNVMGFSTVCSYKIEEGKSYPVIFDITVFDNIEINEGIEGVKSLKRIDNSFKYRISGILNRGFIDAGITITDEDEIFLERSEYFNKYVEIEVVRINIEFVKGG
ncbi:hypothetical protein H0911_19960 [Bacillus sp. HSTU-bmb18]